jgi:single-stranded-DNA-specific exonuclease
LVSTKPADEAQPASAWVEATVSEPEESLRGAGISARLARLLALRGVTTAAEAEAFLAPSVSDLHDPFELDGMEAAVERLAAARAAGETVMVVGDYDVDGVTAVAQLVAVFGACGIETAAVLPHRIRDGYGLQTLHADEAARRGARVLVTADCGSLAHEAVGRALELGIDVIITDHHIPGAPHPPQVVHINPKRPSCAYPFSELSGAGLAFKLAMAVAQRLERPVPPELLLRVASLGTVADMVPLRGENRTIAAVGLASLAETESLGLRALLDVSGVRPPIRAGDVGFRLGPRLNAAGRMDSADDALRLLLTRNAAEATELATRLDSWNRERQQAESDVVEEAREYFEGLADLPRVLVRAAPGWHRGVVGIAAGRISRAFHRPTILLAADDGEATGSGRSIAGIDLHGFLLPFADRLERFGGHAQAVGLTVRAERLPDLEAAWQQAAQQWDEELLVRRVVYDASLELGEVDDGLLGEVLRLEPFGVANPRPVFRLGPLRAVAKPRAFGRDHLEIEAVGAAGAEFEPVPIVGWRWAERGEIFAVDFEILARVGRDDYRDRVRLELVDARPIAVDA